MVVRPELAVQIARIATTWSRVEGQLGVLIVQLLGADAHTGIKMYRALSGAAAQKAVLRAVARDRLNQKMLDELEALLAEFKKVASRRNDVVHGYWLLSDDHPDELVWGDTGDDLLGYSHFWSGWHSASDHEGKMEWARNYDRKRNDYLLYGMKDFTALMDSINSIGSRLRTFCARCEQIHKPASNKLGVGGE